MFRGLISRGEWGARPPKSRSPMLAPLGESVVHWEGPQLWAGVNVHDLATHDRCAAKVRGIQNFHMGGIYADIAYNHVACPHGYVFEGRGGGIANGANGNTHINSHRYAVCALLGQNDPITPDLLDALAWTLGVYVAIAGAPNAADGHRDVNTTACPGEELHWWANAWHAGAVPMPGPQPPPQPLPAPGPIGSFPPWPGRVLRLTKPMMRGSDIGTYQDRLAKRGWKIDVDCTFGPQTDRIVRAFQREKGLLVDGKVGPVTWAAAWTAPVT